MITNPLNTGRFGPGNLSTVQVVSGYTWQILHHETASCRDVQAVHAISTLCTERTRETHGSIQSDHITNLYIYMDFMDYLDQPNVYKGLRRPGCVHDVHPRPDLGSWAMHQFPGRRPVFLNLFNAKSKSPEIKRSGSILSLLIESVSV